MESLQLIREFIEDEGILSLIGLIFRKLTKENKDTKPLQHEELKESEASLKDEKDQA